MPTNPQNGPENSKSTDLALIQTAGAVDLQRRRSGDNPPPIVRRDDDGEEDGLNLRRSISALLRYKWLLVLGAVLGLGGGFAGSRMVLPKYQVQATLWIEAPAGNNGQGPIVQAQLLGNGSWVNLLKSFVVLDSVVLQQRLYLAYNWRVDSALFHGFGVKQQFAPASYEVEVASNGRDFTLKSKQGAPLQRGHVGDSVGAALGMLWVPPARALTPGRKIDFTLVAPRNASLKLAKDLVARQTGVNFMQVELTGHDPDDITHTLNAVTTRFVAVAADLKRNKLNQLTGILGEQLNTAYSALREAEGALESFRVRTVTQPTEEGPAGAGIDQTRDPVYNNYFNMRVEREQLGRDHAALARALSQPDSISRTALEVIPSVRNATDLSATLAQLSAKQAEARAMQLQFSANYAPLRRVLDELNAINTQTLPTQARQLLNQIIQRENDLDTRLGNASSEMRLIPVRTIEEGRLRRDMQIADQLYTTLQRNYAEARLAEVSSIPDVRLVDNAVPPDSPLKNTKMILIAGGLMGGIGIAAALALALDFFDRRVRYPEQVTRDLGLTILGSMPRIHGRGVTSKTEDSAALVEALREIRLNVARAYGSAGPLLTAITSPGSGDGKSFLSANLAVSFADAGHRTILIDGDIRRGVLHRTLGANRKPGLLDYLSGQADQDSVIQHTGVSGVDFIGCGTRKIAGPELLGSPAMGQLVASLRSQYGVILIDSSPLGAGVDPLVLSMLTGNLLVVLRNGYTDRELALVKLGALQHMPIRVLGAVLNDVKAEGLYKYYSYLPGYRSEDELEEPKRGVPVSR